MVTQTDFDNVNTDPLKRPPGRPKKDPVKVRSKLIAVRITEHGYGRVSSLAAAKKMKVPEYLRYVLKLLADGTILIR